VNTQLSTSVGWYNGLVSGDFDNDGDMDYIAGNAGQNSFYSPSDEYPVDIYGKDFDSNGSYDAIPAVYLPASETDTTRKEFPAQSRDDLIKQMIEFRNKFKTYKEYGTATFDKFLTKEQLNGALLLSANNFKTSYIRNDGNDQFTIIALPAQAQISGIFGMVAEDVDGDGNLDVIMNGNDYGTEVSVGRYDALNGLVLKGDGKGNFEPLTILQSGIFIPGNGKALVKFFNKSGECFLAASQNRGPLKVFLMKQQQHLVPVQFNETYALLKLKNGKTRKQELHYGEGFLSQSGRFINTNAQVVSVDIFDSKGNKRTFY
ncbi:MAG: VCBS repeat-containing protein, partial [Parafilimonas sp.]